MNLTFIQNFKKKILLLSCHSGIIIVLVWLYYFKTKTIGTRKKNAKNILVLNHKRFRGELEIICQFKSLNLVYLPFSWYTRFLNIFFTHKQRKLISLKKESENSKNREDYHQFLIIFLKKYYKLLNIKGVIGASPFYKQDYDWGIISSKIKVPYIVMHKESIFDAKGHINGLKKLFNSRKKFQGDHIFVHNENVKKIWIDTKFVTKQKISVLGNIRMQKFFMLKSSKKIKYDLTLFSFGSGNGLSTVNNNKMWPNKNEIGFHKLCYKTHTEILKLAKNNPDKNFCIKLKWGGTWVNYIEKVALDNKIDLNKLSNLYLNYNHEKGDISHNLILESKIIVGFNSTTLIESIQKNKIVILPIFEEANTNFYKDFIFFLKENEYFHYGRNLTTFRNLLTDGINGRLKKKYNFNKKNLLFVKYLLPNKNLTIKNYEKKILEII